MEPEPSTPAPPRPRILIVDDNPAKRVFLRNTLAEVDAELMEAGDGSQALAACREHEFALFILDVQMPGMDGFQLARALAEDPRARETPIIFVTAFYGDINQTRGYGSGAVDYLQDPVHPIVLISKVRVFLELYRGKQLLKREIVERKRLEELAQYQATHDPLTGLPNRLLFIDHLNSGIARARRRSTQCTVLFIDIDGFKAVNDGHGHLAGDLLLKQIAQRLQQAFRTEDAVARLGGDEFVVMLEQPITETDVRSKAEELIAELNAPYRLELPGISPALEVRIGASIGAALYPDHAQTPDELIRVADDAMYTAKKSGKNRCILAERLG